MEAWATKLKRACDFHKWSKPASENGLEKLPSYGDSPPPHHITSHHITPHLTKSHHISSPTLTAKIPLVICRNHCGRLLASTVAKDWSSWWVTIPQQCGTRPYHHGALRLLALRFAGKSSLQVCLMAGRTFLEEWRCNGRVGALFLQCHVQAL